MDHREQMRQEAEQWQKKSVRLIWGVRYGVLALGILVVLVLFLRNLGFPKAINEVIPATVITEAGQTLECTLELRGEITNYPLNRNKFGMDDSVTVYVSGNRLLVVSFNVDRSTGFIVAQNRNAVCMMSLRRDAVILETDIQNLFPDMESQRCLVYYGCDSFDIPGEYAELFTFFRK